MLSDFADELRRARYQKGLSLRDLSNLAGVTPSYISDLENARRVPSEAVVRVLGALLALDPENLCALAGILGDEAKRYLKRNPDAVRLVRLMARENMGTERVARLLVAASL